MHDCGVRMAATCDTVPRCILRFPVYCSTNSIVFESIYLLSGYTSSPLVSTSMDVDVPDIIPDSAVDEEIRSSLIIVRNFCVSLSLLIWAR